MCTGTWKGFISGSVNSGRALSVMPLISALVAFYLYLLLLPLQLLYDLGQADYPAGAGEGALEVWLGA